ncbi:MAG: DUF805 domain-containing protein [Gemmobacter sp.]|uniref:DUF805 domain-containing protein n=1 Tax=Gemmobacter sp. TaxID=1898957 RepID=UPI001A4466E3|nr:DUF805 domain-containing protein [Gemmobacter sp.]MBL8560870.1 DUF805 domain-containing protein [Gemmobacter sp.]
MDIVSSVLTVYRKTFTFRGRAQRSEFWWFALVQAILVIAVAVVEMRLGWSENGTAMFGEGPLSLTFHLGHLMTWISVTVRRFHDMDRSGWWVLLALMPIGSLIQVIWLARRGTQGENRFGPDPLQPVQMADVFA